MGLSNYIASVLTLCLGKFLSGFSSETVRANVLSGCVRVKSINILSSTLPHFPFEILCGSIGSVSVSIPWRSLHKTLCRIEVHDVSIVIALAASHCASGDESAIESKKRLLRHLRAPGHLISDSEKLSALGLFKRLQRAILNKIVLVIDDSCFLVVFSAPESTIVQLLQIDVPKLTSRTAECSMDNLSSEKLTIRREFVCNDITLSVGNCPHLIWQDWKDANGFSLRKFVQQSVGMSTLLKNLHATLTVEYCSQTKISSGMVRCNVNLEPGKVSLSAEELRNILQVASVATSVDSVNQSTGGKKTCTPQEKWQLALSRIRAQRESQHFSWKHYIEWKKLYHGYYVQCLEALSPDAGISKMASWDDLSEAEKLLTCDDLLACWVQARDATRRYRDLSVVDPWRPYSHMARNSEPVHCSSFVVKAFVDWEQLTVGLDGAFLTVHDILFNVVVDGPSTAVSCKVSRASMKRSLEKSNGESAELMVLDKPSLSFHHDGDGDATIVTDTQTACCSMSTSDFSALVEILEHYTTLYKGLQPLYAGVSETSNGPRGGFVKKSRKKPLPITICLRVTKAVFALYDIVAHWTNVSIQSNGAALSSVWETAVVVTGEEEIARVNQVSARLVATKRHLLVGAVQVVISENLEGLERLKETIASIRLSIGPFSTTSDYHSQRSGPTATFDVQCNISSITFSCIQAGNWSILASVGNGFTVEASCLGLEADGQTVPEARMSLRLWTGSWLLDAPIEMGLMEPGGLGFHGEVWGLRVHLDDSITTAIEHLYDAIILLMNEADDVHVYLRSAGHSSPSISGQIAVHDSLIGFPSDDTGSIPKLTVHGGDSGIVVSLGRYADKRMWVTIELGDTLGAYTVSGSSAPAEIFPYPSGGSFVVKMSTFHPAAEDIELFPFRRLHINVLAVNRCIVVHSATMQALWAHFNNPLASMGRIRAIASRVHFSCRASRNRTLPPTSPASKILSMKAAESYMRSSFKCVPPVDDTSVYSPPGFPWDLDVSFKVHAVVVLYPLNASGSICLRSELSHSHASLTSRAGCLRMDARSNATFPQIVTSSGGILGAAAYRGAIPNRKHDRQDVKRKATLSLQLIYTNDSRPPFHTGVSDESFHVSLRADGGGPIEGRWDDAEFATWLALCKVLHEPSDAMAGAAAVSHDKPPPRRLLSTISIAPVLLHVPSLDCAVVVWGGVQGSLSPGSQTWSVPRLSILHNRQFREWRDLSIKTAQQLLRDGDRDTVVVCQISPAACPLEAVEDRTVPSSTREALAILYVSHLGNSISDPRRRTKLSLGIITCTLSEEMGVSWIEGSAVARGQSLLHLVMHQLSILRQDAPVSGKEEIFGELAAAETPDRVVQLPLETAVTLEGLSVAMEWWSSWRRHKVSVGCRLTGVRYVQSTGTEWIPLSSSSSFTFTGMAASSLLGEGQDDVTQQHTPPTALTVTLASGQFFMSLVDSSSTASGTTLETTDDAFGAYSKQIPLSEVFHLSTDYFPPPSSSFRASDASGATDTTLLVPHLILSPIHFKLTELPYAFLFELPQRLKQLSARVARTDRRMGSPSESEAPVSDIDAAEGEAGDVAPTSSSRASTLFTASSFDLGEGVRAAAQGPRTTTDLTTMTELGEEAVGGLGDSNIASATISRHEQTQRNSPWSSIVYQVTAIGLQIAAAASSSTPEESQMVVELQDSCSSSNHPRKGKDSRGSPRTTPPRADDTGRGQLQSTQPCCIRSSRSPRVVGFSRLSVDTGYSGGSSPGRIILDVFVGLMTVHRQGGSGGAWNFLCTEVNCKSYDSTMVQVSTVLPLAAMQGIRCTLPSATAASLSSIRQEGSAAPPPRQAEGSDVSSAKVGVVGMTVESVTVSLSMPDARPLLSILVEVPARRIFPCYRGAATGGRRDGASPSSGATPSRQSALRLTRISGETWALEADLYLSRREHVLYFSSKDTNHLTVDMNGHCIYLLAGHDADDPREPWGGQQADGGDTRAAHMVMAVEDGLTLTFTHGSFRLPLHTWSNALQEAIDSNGVEKAILRFVGLGEGSYIQCEEVRLGFEERRRVAVGRGGGREGARGKRHPDRGAWTPLTRFQERKPPVDVCEPSNHGGAAAITRRWRLQVASLSVSVRGAGEPRCLCLQTSVQVHVEVGRGATRGIDAKIVALSLSTSPWPAGVEVAAAVLGTRPANDVVLQPIDIDVCTAGSSWAVSCGDLRIDLTRADVQTVRTLLDSITSTREQTKYLTSSPVERQYLLLLDATLAWRTAVDTHEATVRQQPLSPPQKDGTDGGEMDRRNSSLVDDLAAATAGTTAPVPPSTPTQLSVAVFIPSVEATISDVRYPLIRACVRDVCWRLTSPHAAMRTTSLQCHELLVGVYGKGRWDALVRATPVWQVSWTQTTSRNSSNDHLAITGEGCDVQSSYMILSKVLFAGRRAAFVLRPLMAEGGVARTGQVCSDDDDETTESGRCEDAETRRAQAATHRFVNHFNCTFFLLVGAEDATSGEWLVLRPGASVDASIPYKRASDAYVFVFPDDCVDVTKDHFSALPRYQLNRKGKQQDLSHARVLVCALQYGQATGLVMNQDLLVVLSCTDQEAVPAAATPWNFTACGRVGGEDGEAAYWASRKTAGAGDRGDVSATVSPTTQTGTSLPDLRSSGSTEAGLVVVQVHAKMTLCNDSGIPLQVQQQRMEEDATAYLPCVPMPPGRHFPLCGSCVGLVLKCAVGPRIYSATLSVLGLSSGTFIELWPELPSSSACFQDTALSSKIERMELRADAKADGRPVVLFVVARHLPESLSTSLFLHPRLTVINHMGIPIRVSLWQRDSDAGPQCAADVSCMQPWKRVSVADGGGGRRSQAREAFYGSLIPIGASNHLPHLGAIPVVQCSFQRNLVMGLSFTQCTGDDIYTEDLAEVVSILQDAVEGHPRLLPLRDANGRTFIVQVTVLVRTVILSVGVWVTNLTEYPLQLTDGIVRRQLCAGQNPTTGIIPSRGTPFLIGCRLQDFAQVFFKIGLDSAWSDAIPVVMGSSGVLESHQPDLQITRSSNYAILFPNAQEGRPLVLVISPRWMVYNNTGKQLRLFFDYPGMKRAVLGAARAARQAVLDGDPVPDAEMAAVSSVASIVLKPGEHHVSCVGTLEGNRLALQEVLDGMVPSVASITDQTEQRCRISEYYVSQRTTFMSVDAPGQATFNLWAAPRSFSVQQGVSYGSALTVSRPSWDYLHDLAAFDPYHDEAVVTGRLAVSVEEAAGMLAIVLQPVRDTKIRLENRTAQNTVMVRQEGSRRRNMVPPRRNRHFLWEDSAGEHVIRVHIVGWKGQWFRVDFGGGDCRVSRHRAAEDDSAVAAASSRTASLETPAVLPFYVHGVVNKEKTLATIVITDRAVPSYALLSHWRRSFALSLRVALAQATWLHTGGAGSHPESDPTHAVFSSRPHRLASWVLEGVALDVVDTEDSRYFQVAFNQMQGLDELHATVVLYRARMIEAPGTAPRAGGPSPPPGRSPYTPTGLWGSAAAGFRRGFSRGGSSPAQSPESQQQQYAPPMRSPRQVSMESSASAVSSLHYDRVAAAQGRELPCDVVLQYSSLKYADGMVRLTDVNVALTALVVVVTDTWLAQVLYEVRRLRQLLGGGTPSSAELRSLMMRGAIRLPSCGSPAMAAGGGCTPSGEESVGAFPSSSGVVVRQPTVTGDAGAAMAVMNITRCGFVPQPRFIAMALRNLGGVAGGGGGSQLRGSAASAPPPSFLFIEHFRTSRVTLYMSFVRHRPDPLRPLLGAYTLMLPTTLAQRELHLAPLTITKQLETTGSLQARIHRWAMQGLRHQWTKVTKIGTVLDTLRWWRGELPLRRAPRALTSGRVRRLTARTVAEAMASHDCPVSWTDVKLPFMASEDTSDDECERGGGL